MIRILALIITLLPFIALGQNSYHLSFTSQEKQPFQPKKQKTYENKEEVYAFLERLKAKHIKKGYVLASLDSIEFRKDTALIHYYKGEQFEKLSITSADEDAYIISKVP